MRERRVASLVAMLVGGLALSLACFGIVGLVSCGVAVRTKEIGIRRALGAERWADRALLLRQLLLPVALGLLVGHDGRRWPLAGVLEGAPFICRPSIWRPFRRVGDSCPDGRARGARPVSRALGADPVQALKHE